MLKRITQSFQKDMRFYLAGMKCGNIIRERWIKDRVDLRDPDDEPGAMELGAYFEYLLSTLIAPKLDPALPKDGKVPQPIYQSSKIKANGGHTKGLKPEHLYEKYRDAHDNAHHLAGYFKSMGFKVIAIQKKLTKGNREGTLDIVMQATRAISLGGVELKKGENFIIDIKYSGLLKDTTPRSNVHGWQWSDAQKEYHGTQAKQYSYVGGSMKFFFMVVNSSNGDGQAKFFYTPVDKGMINAHLAEGNEHFEKLKVYAKLDNLEARPNFMVCGKCPLRSECKDRHTYPHAEVVDLFIDNPKYTSQ